MRIAAVLALFLAACAGKKPPPTWVPTAAAFAAPVARFEVAVPAGWMRRNATDRELLVVTRDGTALQRIVVRATELGKPMGLGESNRQVTAGLSAQELAELAIDDLRSRAGDDVRILENAPATLSGRAGFRLVASVRPAKGLARRVALYGVSAGPRFYSLLYVAPERHYFGLDLATFEDMARSFRLTAPPPSA